MSLEVMKQALEALEYFDSEYDVKDEITALRAAIAEASMQRLTDVHQEMEAPRVNQCAEVCERAKLCAICARGLEEMELRLSPDQYRSIGILVEGLLRAGAKITAIDPKTCLRPMPDGSINCGLDIRYDDSPRREWVGLTDGQVMCIIEEEAKSLKTKLPFALEMRVARAIEAKLKEKNYGGNTSD
jgi:hypothetical protein